MRELLINYGPITYMWSDRENWTEIFRSKRLTGRDDGLPIDIKFPSDAKYMHLIGLDAGNGAQNDHHVWADAKFY